MIKLKETSISGRAPQVLREEVIGGGKLTYLLTKTDTVVEKVPVCVYGLAITSTLFGEAETAAFADVSSIFEHVEELFEILVRNTVLPSSLREILEDFANS